VQVEQLDRTVALVGCLLRLVRFRARARVRVGSGSRQGLGLGLGLRLRLRRGLGIGCRTFLPAESAGVSPETSGIETRRPRLAAPKARAGVRAPSAEGAELLRRRAWLWSRQPTSS
jgi:hypothetical protein